VPYGSGVAAVEEFYARAAVRQTVAV